MMRKLLPFITGIAILLSACTTVKPVKTVPAVQEGSKVPSEFRAAWVATVGNSSWPSKPGLSTQQQQQEALILLDYLKKHNFNAVIFQVRPQADALYKSDLEPWSYYPDRRSWKSSGPLL